jgi:hypothetical protein
VGLIGRLGVSHTFNDATGLLRGPYLRRTFAGLSCDPIQALLPEPIGNKSRGPLAFDRFNAVDTIIYIYISA